MKITPIKVRRINLGIATEDAAEMLGISKSHFYKLEQGYRTPSTYLMVRMAKAYKCSVDDIGKDFGIDYLSE